MNPIKPVRSERDLPRYAGQSVTLDRELLAAFDREERVSEATRLRTARVSYGFYGIMFYTEISDQITIKSAYKRALCIGLVGGLVREKTPKGDEVFRINDAVPNGTPVAYFMKGSTPRPLELYPDNMLRIYGRTEDEVRGNAFILDVPESMIGDNGKNTRS